MRYHFKNSFEISLQQNHTNHNRFKLLAAVSTRVIIESSTIDLIESLILMLVKKVILSYLGKNRLMIKLTN